MLRWFLNLFRRAPFRPGQAVTLIEGYEYIPEGAEGEVIDYNEDGVRVYFDLRQYAITIPHWPGVTMTNVISVIPEEYIQ